MKFQRYELKYIVPLTFFNSLKKDLELFCSKDPHIPSYRDSYCVHSIYYDTQKLAYYHDKINGIEYRKKFRIRYYGDQNPSQIPEDIFLEVKEKYGPVISKDRFKTDKQKVESIFKGSCSEKNKSLDKILSVYHRDSLLPNVLISYKRIPLVGDFELNTRITFDYEIKSHSVYESKDFLPNISEHSTFLLPPNCFLLEIKVTDAIPGWLNRIIEKYELKLTAFSKYANGVEKSNIMRKMTGEINELL